MGAYVGSVTLSLAATDAGSGVAQTFVSFDEGNSWQVYTNEILRDSAEGQFVQYYSTDQSGNNESPKFCAFWISDGSVQPELLAISDQTVEEEELLTLQVQIKEVLNLGALTFSLIDAPTGATINPFSGRFEWTPTLAQGPAGYTFSIHVTDGTASDVVAVSVVVTGFDSAQSFTEWASQTVDPAQRGETNCPAGDGIANLLKYAIGLDPETAYSTSDLLTYSLDTIGNFTITFRRVKAATNVKLEAIWTPRLVNPDWKVVVVPQLEKIGETDFSETWRATLSDERSGFVRLKAYIIPDP